MSHDLVPIDAQAVYLPQAMSTEQMTRQVAELKDFCDAVMTENVDYGTIPGTQKPSLLKPGAEKMLRLFGLVVDIDYMPTSQIDLKGGIIDIDLVGTVRSAKSGLVLGNVHANINSEEFRYWSARNPVEAYGDRGKNKRPQRLADQKNTLLKMGDKRIWVAAALFYTLASELFTQDVEDTADTQDTGQPSQPNPTNGNGAAPETWPCPDCLKAGRKGMIKVLKTGTRDDGSPWTLYGCTLSRKDGTGQCQFKPTFSSTEAGMPKPQIPGQTDLNGNGDTKPAVSPEEQEERTKLIVQMKRRAEEQLVGANSSLVDKPDELTRSINELTAQTIKAVHGEVVPMSQLTLEEMRKVVGRLTPTEEELPTEEAA